MKTSDFSFELPEELVAQEPAQDRGSSRLLVLDRADGTRHHSQVPHITDFVTPGSVMVFNNSKVRKARVYATDPNGERPQEFLLVKKRSAHRWLAIGRNSRKLKPGRRFRFPGGVEGEVSTIDGPYREIEFSQPVDNLWLEAYGHMPLPPYIHRSDTTEDAERYQTVYAATLGSVAAPTAGLHFTPTILDSLRERGITIAFVTLHVGIGTFLPVRSETLEDHQMHEEEYHVSPGTADLVARAKSDGRPVIAVGTTVVRTLESAWDTGARSPRTGHGATSLFIYPGYKYQVVDQLFTNFHTPESTLLALVSAFAGRDTMLSVYREAVEKRYRFFSYGDAMFIR